VFGFFFSQPVNNPPLQPKKTTSQNPAADILIVDVSILSQHFCWNSNFIFNWPLPVPFVTFHHVIQEGAGVSSVVEIPA